jgi:NADPH:quinone reductase
MMTNTSVMGVASAEFWSGEPDYAGQQWCYFMPLVQSGSMEPPIGPVFALDDAAGAIPELDERRAFGKVLIRMRKTTRKSESTPPRGSATSSQPLCRWCPL